VSQNDKRIVSEIHISQGSNLQNSHPGWKFKDNKHRNWHIFKFQNSSHKIKLELCKVRAIRLARVLGTALSIIRITAHARQSGRRASASGHVIIVSGASEIVSLPLNNLLNSLRRVHSTCVCVCVRTVYHLSNSQKFAVAYFNTLYTPCPKTRTSHGSNCVNLDRFLNLFNAWNTAKFPIKLV